MCSIDPLQQRPHRKPYPNRSLLSQPPSPLSHSKANLLTWQRYSNRSVTKWPIWIDGWQRWRHGQRCRRCQRRTKMMMIPTTKQQPSPPPKAIDLTITLPTPMNQLPARVQVDPCNLNALDRPFLTTTTTTPPTPTHPTQSMHQSDLLPTPPAPLSNLQNTAETSHTYDLTTPQRHDTATPHEANDDDTVNSTNDRNRHLAGHRSHPTPPQNSQPP